MDWEDCEYMHIAERISDADIDKLIDIMIDNCDKNGKCFESYNAEEIIKEYIHSPEVITMIEDTAEKEIKCDSNDIKKRKRHFIPNDFEEVNISFRKRQICERILSKIERVARKKRADRIYSRVQIGEKVDFNSCISHSSFLGKVVFYKDGGWGIADVNGNVLVKNHLSQKPSWTNNLHNVRNSPYFIIQDRDTGLYGVLSLDNFKEVIHCLYDKIESVSYWNGKETKYLVKVKRKDKWGCYDEDCSFIIDCKYDEISILDGWIECCREGYFLYPEIDYNKYGSIYDGTKDLFDIEGNLLIGGYNHLELEYKQYFKFYFGTKYENYHIKQTDFYDNEYYLTNYRLNFEDSLCLVLDRKLTTVFKCNGQYRQIPFGKTFQSLQDLKDYLPNEFLLQGYVDLSDIGAFIYLKKSNGEKYIISDYIDRGVEDLLGDTICEPRRWIDTFIEDDEVIIIRILGDGTLSWRTKVNEIGTFFPVGQLYRLGDKVGFYSENGISSANYAAVSIDNQDDKTYVAQISYKKEERIDKRWNHNFILHKNYILEFYEITKNGEKIRKEDDWKLFNPTKHKWFPSDFLKKNGLVYDDVAGGYAYESSGLSYEKYGGYNGYDDDTIDYGFDGFPEATWNVD